MRGLRASARDHNILLFAPGMVASGCHHFAFCSDRKDNQTSYRVCECVGARDETASSFPFPAFRDFPSSHSSFSLSASSTLPDASIAPVLLSDITHLRESRLSYL